MCKITTIVTEETNMGIGPNIHSSKVAAK
jgi:hypothetical protein